MLSLFDPEVQDKFLIEKERYQFGFLSRAKSIGVANDTVGSKVVHSVDQQSMALSRSRHISA